MTVTGTVTQVPGGIPGAEAGIHLRLLATSDLHAHLLPYNYYADRRDDGVGLAGLAALVEQARAECPNTLLFDNGDTLQGAPLGDAALSDLMPSGAPHPMIAAMNGLGYDAASLGNHDFDYGLEALEAALAGARYPVVLANVRRAGDGGPLVAPHVILDRAVIGADGAVHRLRIGVTGATPPQVMQWGRTRLAGRLEVDPILPAVAREVALLRAAGADVVVVLAHTGLGTDTAAPGDENVGRCLAALPGVDAVIAGHTHRAFPGGGEGLVAGRPLVQPGFFGSHLGQIDLELRAGAQGWVVRRADARLRTGDEAGVEDRRALRRRLRRLPDFRAQMARGHRLTRSFSARPIGATAVPLETYFSLLAPCAATQLIAEAQRVAVAPLLAGRDDLAALPLLSCTTPFKAGGRGGPDAYTDIPAGPLRLRHAADLYPYANGLALVRATGAQLREWLERSASAFLQVVPGGDGSGQPQPMLDHGFASYNFDIFDGLTYEIDLSRPARTNAEGDEVRDGPGRIRNLRLDGGGPVRDEAEFLVVTNTYRAAGGGHFPVAAACAPVCTLPDPVRDLLVAHVAARPGPLAPRPRPSWSFTPLGGTAVVYETGPGALAHGDRAAALGLAPDGIGAAGFARYLLRL
ncbi:bifunctional 2',3'-cyclic-nucleotide 2'-phosphodiesterase/3'-nucleotidase [Roseicyclus persicicus]|uniref:Bifunctional 2',3'-cyclic-nucleotide 2'-phosphodiesterase/3'-nucleotidase n=1 Tax=Roseicyclus persicicus TaxID=2650661 RepID=A0A7X6GV54_9RHOB|nr:bifunctional 2',3'-cyclic-nucleotide 2'-phosphodiesterase/3'-nucleotidase [Roseibacterium persicicum]NKX42966.1 bifunctional 2',3'-cyclic-nucleotide 2'-phosphodiesterase/3'-nucleotidase [Roseibacterium persicicum]